MKPIQIRNGVIVYYGNRVGMVQDGQAVVDPMFEREELKDFLNHQHDIREIKWQNGIFDRLVNHAELSPDQPALKNVRVWQLKPDVDIRMKFISYEEMCRQFGPPGAEQYQVVYDGAVETNDLEVLYTKFNTEWPEGYTGHSLSMSDVLELYDREQFFSLCGSVRLSTGGLQLSGARHKTIPYHAVLEQADCCQLFTGQIHRKEP